MKSKHLSVFVLTFFAAIYASDAFSEPLIGDVGSSSKYGSGWLDLKSITQFQRGDKIKLKIGGTAKKIILRFLAKGEDADGSSGIDGGIVTVPESRILVITLSENHNNIRQLSVHGKANPWGLYFMGESNGPATILSAERISQK